MTRREVARAVAGTVGGASIAGPALGVTPAFASSNASSNASGAYGKSAVADRAGKYGPLVRHTRRGPTGYEVTFRYHAPKATRVQLKGEWYFERPSMLTQRLTSPDHLVETPGLLPEQWKPGDVPASHPNSTSPYWPVVDMTKGKDGVWTHTTPLPGGVYTYGFFVDGDAEDTTTTGQLPDPGNPAWNVVDGVPQGTAVDRSQIYVPSDPDFSPVDVSWQGPSDGPRGTLRQVTYSSPGHVTPVDQNYLVLYTPPKYDAKRAKPYPTFYLSHGGGENHMGWSTQGNMANILDNLINAGEIQPMVVVMPNATGYASSSQDALHRADLVQRIVPWVEAHYNVSTAASDRAYSGLSAGGMRTSYLMLNNAEQFAYYGMMSAGLPPGTVLTAEQVAALRKVSIYVGSGWQDPINPGFSTIHRGPFRAVRDLTAAGVHVQSAFIDGGHEWHVWRILLRDFLTRVAFLPATVAPESWGA
ncbi:alpha/beta hydrolase-fold protein [Streptomyces justiciae]|uniref:Alpha/beta hydrolase-fold protein n=1 Tax=Streptomyces justiciae TaxID=2780140 RepID=A0ABU3M7R4_9ACTN|nr:alpha/beta hydrolase-fold protein [Streptomyces justiciae]MDT7847539.1 alpha/beta hydrolase-fold protein [Streptomyces justiciae]